MSESETRMILAQCSAMDNRKVTDAAVVMWFGLFRSYTYGEVKWAIAFHYSTETEYLMPAHLIGIIHQKRAEYRMMNPGLPLDMDSWLEFELLQEVAAQEARAIRATGARSAVDVMDSYDPKELES